MDAFHSIVINVESMGVPQPVLMLHEAFVTDDMLAWYESEEAVSAQLSDGFDLDAWGWTDGNLNKLLLPTECGRSVPLFFRGAAIFDNFDDAKNDYLMDPYLETSTAEPDQFDIALAPNHTPFGMVIPRWDNPGGDKHPALVGVTIILCWQELI